MTFQKYLTIILVLFWVMVGSGCSTQQSKIKINKAEASATRATDDLSEIITDISCVIDPRYLVLCEPLQQAPNDQDQVILRTHVRNMRKVHECYIIHNEFVRQYKSN